MINLKPNWYRTSIECECGDPWHRLCMDFFMGDANIPEYDEISVVLALEATGFWNRIKVAWKVIRGMYEYQEIILSDVGLAQLESAVASIKELHGRTKKEAE